jgi:hypothetical protein
MRAGSQTGWGYSYETAPVRFLEYIGHRRENGHTVWVFKGYSIREAVNRNEGIASVYRALGVPTGISQWNDDADVGAFNDYAKEWTP